MPIRWSPRKVTEAADMIEKYVNQVSEPLEQARIVAREACKIDNLPQYVSQDFYRIIWEIDRAIGGSQFEPIGRLRSGVEAIRKSIPDQAAENEQAKLKHGITQPLM